MLNQLVLSVAEVHNTTISSMVVVTGSFLLLLVLLKKFAWNAIAEVLKKREDKIANDIDAAEQSRIAAKKHEEETQKRLSGSRKEASDIVKNAQKSGEIDRQHILTDANNEASQIKERAEKDISLERQAALQAVKGNVTEISLEIAEKILNKELSPEVHQNLIDQYINDLGATDETR